MLKKKELSIATIKQGTVIDHIDCGKALIIFKLLKLDSYDKKISIAFNLISNTLGKKDIIKIEDKSLSKEEINQLSILSPRITINIIKNYQVRKKYNLEIPKEIKGIFLCQNKTCITHSESIPSHFYIASTPYHIYGTCKYCEQQFNMIEGTHNL